MKAINKINAQYKIFKYYFAEDGALILDSYLLERPEELDGDMVYTVLDIIVKHLLAEYKNLMQLIWAYGLKPGGGLSCLDKAFD